LRVTGSIEVIQTPRTFQDVQDPEDLEDVPDREDLLDHELIWGLLQNICQKKMLFLRAARPILLKVQSNKIILHLLDLRLMD